MVTQEEFEIMRKAIDDYFDNLTPEKLEEDLAKADYEFYRHITTKVIDWDESGEEW